MNEPRDNNRIAGRLAVLNTDPIQGINLVPVQISGNNRILCNTTDGISFVMNPIDPRDENYVGCWLFQGSDGRTYPAVANENGEVLVEL